MSPPDPDPAKAQVKALPITQAIATFGFLHPGDAVFELCIISPRAAKSNLWEGYAGGKKAIVAGWFRDPERAAKLAVQIQAEGIYTTLNTCQEALLARADHRLKANVDRTADHHILAIKNLLIDIDPQRPTGISSTDQEHTAALEMAQIIRADLANEGVPDPLVGDSGNGGHLIYPLDLPNDPESVALVKAVLEALALRYADELARRNLEIDLKVFNPARLTKLYGTWTRKGDNTQDRPHRLAQILSLPEARQPVPLALLKKLAATVQSQGAQAEAKETGTKECRLNVEAYLNHYGVEVVRVKDHGGGFLYCLKECLFDPSHRDNEAAIGQRADRGLFYQCFHNSCCGRTWAEARARISGDDKLTAFMVGGPYQHKGKPREEPPPAGVITGFNLTDMGNALRLVKRHGQDLRYCYPWSKWLAWDGRRWAKDESGEVDRRAKETVRRIYAEAAAGEEKALREALAEHARRSESDAKRQAMINSARSEVPILPDDLDQDPWLLNVENGTLDLRTGELRPHDRQDHITKLAPVHYDRNAECPRWWEFLKRITDNNFDLIDFLQRAVGYSLTGSNREQCLFFNHGLGANGKTTLMEILKTMLGDYGHQTTSETFMAKRQGGQIPNDIAALKGARLVVAVEVESGRRLSEVLVKELTGGDRVAARFLHQEWFSFKPEFKLWLAANHKPVIRGTDDAIWRRIRLIPFTVQIPEEEQDKDLAEKLKTELPGILNWALEGCLNWQDEGLTPPQAVTEATQGYREEMDVLGVWINECCIVSPGASALTSELYKSYTTWAEENGEKRPLSQTAFGTTLTERGFQKDRGEGGRSIRLGIGLKPETL